MNEYILKVKFFKIFFFYIFIFFKVNIWFWEFFFGGFLYFYYWGINIKRMEIGSKLLLECFLVVLCVVVSVILLNIF